MIDTGRRAVKTQSLSLRLDPKTKFILEFVARIKGQSITTVVERAIKEAAENVRTSSDGYNWTKYWDSSEGVRTLNLIADPDYPTNYEEDEIRDFTLAHWQFFYMDESGKAPSRAYVDILWPKIETYYNSWIENKDKNYWIAGEAMMADIRAAKVQTPEWPPVSKPKNTPQTSSVNRTPPPDFDDEIPF